jgi:hypothetical protein
MLNGKRLGSITAILNNPSARWVAYFLDQTIGPYPDLETAQQAVECCVWRYEPPYSDKCPTQITEAQQASAPVGSVSRPRVIVAADPNEVLREQLEFLIEHTQGGDCGCCCLDSRTKCNGKNMLDSSASRSDNLASQRSQFRNRYFN